MSCARGTSAARPNRLINTSAARAGLPFRRDCIANKTQVVSAAGGEEERNEAKALAEEEREQRNKEAGGSE